MIKPNFPKFLLATWLIILTGLTSTEILADSKQNPCNINDNFEHTSALPIGYSVNVPEPIKRTVLKTIEIALSIVQQFAPKEDNLFNWNGDRKVLGGKSFTILITLSVDPLFKELGVSETTNGTGDAITVTAGKKGSDGKLDTENLKIITGLFVDRLFYDTDMAERRDAFARTTVALAHEIYGNVQTFLNINYNDPPEMNDTFRNKLQIDASRAAISFLERLIGSDFYKNLPSDKMRSDFQMALDREREYLQFWERKQT